VIPKTQNDGENDEEAFCDKCVKDFDGAGGCECMDNDDCDPLGLIPEGCSICGQKVMEYCKSKKEEEEGWGATLGEAHPVKGK